MTAWVNGRGFLLICSFLTATVAFASPVSASVRHHNAVAAKSFRHSGQGFHASFSGHKFASALNWARHSGGLQCVPFARTASGIDIGGNAWTWWDQAAGAYERGARPEDGGVLAFRANGRMRLGHVAVVSKIVNAREIEIDQANWSGGAITRGVQVVDVSENNDWTAVRVQMGSHGAFGSIYPTYGFIYDRPDTGTMVAAAPASPEPNLGPAPSDLRPSAERIDAAEADEVAEAPEHPRHLVTRHRGAAHRHASVRHHASHIPAR